MLARMLKLACAASMLIVIGACDGGALTGPEEDAATPLNRTACMAGGDVAVRAGCPGTEEAPVLGSDGPVDPGYDDCGLTYGASASKLGRC